MLVNAKSILSLLAFFGTADAFHAADPTNLFPLKVTVNFGHLVGESFAVSFIDPRTGATLKSETVHGRKVQRLASPPAEDLVLVVRSF
jgi:hypothetical protein